MVIADCPATMIPGIVFEIWKRHNWKPDFVGDDSQTDQHPKIHFNDRSQPDPLLVCDFPTGE